MSDRERSYDSFALDVRHNVITQIGLKKFTARLTSLNHKDLRETEELHQFLVGDSRRRVIGCTIFAVGSAIFHQVGPQNAQGHIFSEMVMALSIISGTSSTYGWSACKDALTIIRQRF